MELGAYKVLDTRNSSELRNATNQFDLILSTINVKPDWDTYFATLRRKGRLHFVGAMLDPLNIKVFPLISGQRSISGSPVGSPASIKIMLSFVEQHNIKPIIEIFRFDQVNEALARLASGKARYRIVLSNLMDY